MILITLGVLVAARVWAPATITYTNNGARLEVVLPELSKLTGLPLRVSPKIAEHVLILRLDNAPVDETLKRIAHTAYATWVKEGGDYVLYPDPERISKAVDASKQKHAEEIVAALTKLAKPGKDDHPWYRNPETDPAAFQRDLSLRNMVGSALPPEAADAIANLRENGRLVFSTDPTPLQLPLPPSSLEAFKTYVPEPPPPAVPGQPQYYSFGRGAPVPSPKNVVKVNVSVVNGGYVLLFEVNWIGKEHTQVYTGNFANLVGDPYAQWAKKPRQPKPLKVRPEELEYLDPVDLNNLKMSPALIAKLRDPLKDDPDSLFGEVLVTYAVEMKQQLIAAPADDEIDDFYNTVPAIQYSDGSKRFTYDASAKPGDGHGWIEVPEKIDYDYKEETAHHSRRRMATGMTELPTVDGATLLDIVRAWRDGLGDIMDMPQARLYFMGEISEFVDLIQTLDDPEIGWLMNGGSFKLGATPPAFQEAFAKITSSQEDASEGWEEDNRYRFDRDSQWFDEAKPPDGPMYDREKAAPSCDFTEWSQTYAPPDTIVSLLSAEAIHFAVRTGSAKLPPEQSVSMSVNNPQGGILGGGGFSVEWRSADRDGFSFGELATAEPLIPPTVLLKVGTCHDYRLRMEFAPGLHFQRECDLTSFAPGAKFVKLDELPEDIKQRLHNARAKITEYKLEPPNQGGDGGGTGPP